MRRALLALAACSGASAPTTRAGSDAAPAPAPAPAPTAATTITYRPPVVGSRWERRQHLESDLPGSSHDDETADETIEILAVTPDQVTREKVTFTKRTGGQSAGAKLEGKTYVLALAGNDLTVTREDGGAVPPGEALEVQRWNGDLRFGDPIEKLIGGKPLVPGQVLAMDPGDLQRLVGGAAASLTCRFEGETGGVARFALDYSVTSGNGHGATVSLTLTGDGQVDVDTGRITGGEGRGSLAVTLTQGNAPVASGTIAASMTTTPL